MTKLIQSIKELFKYFQKRKWESHEQVYFTEAEINDLWTYEKILNIFDNQGNAN